MTIFSRRLAKLLGIDRTYLGRVLSGEKPITAGMIERLTAIRIGGKVRR